MSGSEAPDVPVEPALVVVTPWYPAPDNPYHGVFVRESVRALRLDPATVLVVHLDNRPPDQVGEPVAERTPEGTVLRVGVPVPPGTSRAATAQAHRDALRRHAPGVARWAVVHAHVGMPTGWAVAQVVEPSTRLVVTEHATYLPTILRTPVGHRMYGDLLDRADLLLTVGEAEARALRRQFPRSAVTVLSGGNPVHGDTFVPRPSAPSRLDHWLYVGNLVPRKGVARAIEAFARWTDGRPDAVFTIVGDGPQRTELAEQVRAARLGERVQFAGTAGSDALVEHLHTADVLVHLSAYETFGLTVVEAALTGLPVVVTTCGGPSETLDHAASAGLVRFVAVDPEPNAVVDAVTDLERAVPGVDRDGVRAVLLDRYGDRAYGERLARVLAGGPLARTAEVPRTVLGVALSPAGTTAVARAHQEVLRTGHRAVLLTDQRWDAVETDRRVDVVDLHPTVGRALHHAVPDVLVRRVPGAVLRTARGVVGAAAALPGPQRRAASRGVHLLSGVLARQERIAAAVRTEVLHPRVNAHLDPPRVRRLVERHVVPRFERRPPEVVLVGDEEGRAVAEHLARVTGAVIVAADDVVGLHRALEREPG